MPSDAAASRREARRNRRVVAIWAFSSLGIATAVAVAAVSKLEVRAWLAAVVAALGTLSASVIPVVVKRLETKRGARQERSRALSRLLACPLAPLESVDPYHWLGVTLSRIAEEHRGGGGRPPYVEREGADTRLREALSREEPLVLVTGPSKSGKSRTMFEAALAVWPHQTVAVPDKPRGNPHLLSELLDLVSELGREAALLWLDDLDDYLRAGALDVRRLRRWRDEHPHLIVLATMRDSALEPVESHQENRSWIGKEVEDVLNSATTVRLAAELRADELAEAERLYPGVDLSTGIGAGLVAGQLLVRRLQAGEEEHPEGVAVVLSVADWRRAGFTQPAELAAVREVYRPYFRELRPRLAASDESFERGLAWSTSELEQLPGVALVFTADDGSSLQADDYVVAYLDGEVGDGTAEPIAEAMWTECLKQADAGELMAVGYTAYVRGNAEIARRAWTRGADSADPQEAPKAMVALGVLLEQRFQDFGGARSAFERAAETQHPEEAPKAMMALGVLLEQRFQDFDGARHAFERAAATDHPEEAPKANVALGVLLQNRLGDPEAAHLAFERAAASNHPEEAPRALNANAYLFEQQSRLHEAIEWYERAGATAHAVEGPKGRENAARVHANLAGTT